MTKLGLLTSSYLFINSLEYNQSAISIIENIAIIAIAIDIVYYLWGLLKTKSPKLYLSALLYSPLYLVIWLFGTIYSFEAKHHWLRARK